MRRAAALLAVSLLGGGCEKPAVSTGGHRMPTPAPGAGAGPGSASPGDQRKALLADVRKRSFKLEDFIEGEDNRDPFRSYLSEFPGGHAVTSQYKILLSKYSLEELKLIAIVGPASEDRRTMDGGKTSERVSTQARAMFLDPSGTGVSVVRGDHLSKSDARVTRIAADKGKVFLELKANARAGKTATVEQVIDLHPASELPMGATP